MMRCAIYILAVPLVAMAVHSLPAADFQKQEITFNLQAEPRSLDPHVANGIPEAHVILNVIEGLTRTNEKGQAVPAIAREWEVSPDGKTYTFHLRDVKWANGDMVTAQDFVYGWRRCLAPATAGEYAYQLYFVEGAEEFSTGKTADPATIGVTALSTNTLQVRLKNPTSFFPSVLAHYAYSPLNEKWLGAHPNWTTNVQEYPSNGPFRIAEWRRGDRIILEKNPTYYNAQSVKLNRIVMTMITNDSTALLQWQSGKIDVTDSVPLPDIPRLKTEGKYRSEPYLGVYYVAVQNQARPFDDPRVRRAFALSVNRQQIVQAILRGGQKPAFALVPPATSKDGSKDFRETGGDLFRENIAEAKRLLAEAGFPNGRGFPRIKYLFNDREDHRIIAQALQNMWMTALNVRVDLDVQEWKVYLQNRQHHNYQLARAGWIGDYFDPVTFLDMFSSKSGNNDFQYENAAFDNALADAKKTSDAATRNRLMHDAEKRLIADDMAVIPLYFYVKEFVEASNVKGIVRNALGYMYFDQAYVSEK